jgi:hypothetical protein
LPLASFAQSRTAGLRSRRSWASAGIAGCAAAPNSPSAFAQITPAVNMCYPPLAWQTYDIDFTAARYDTAGKKTKLARCTVKFNGVTILDDVEILHSTPGGIVEGPEARGFYLQAHGLPVFFRNIWTVEKKPD